MKNTRKLVENLGVCEAEDLESPAVQNLFPFLIVDALTRMNAAIDLNDEIMFDAEKVHNEPLNRDLTPKFKSGTPSIAQGLPQDRFRLRHSPPKATCVQDFPSAPLT